MSLRALLDSDPREEAPWARNSHESIVRDRHEGFALKKFPLLQDSIHSLPKNVSLVELYAGRISKSPKSK